LIVVLFLVAAAIAIRHMLVRVESRLGSSVDDGIQEID
jgi:hypothetical protein